MNAPHTSGSHPVEGGVARYGRLSVEQRILGFHTTLWMVAVGLAVAWMLALLSPERVAQIDWLSLSVPIGAAFVAHMLGLIAAMPRSRWLRGGTLAEVPSAAPLMLIGIFGAPFYALLWMRNERSLPAEGAPRNDDEIEAAFARLLALPRMAASGLALTLGLALIVDALLLAAELPLPLNTALGWALLVAAMVGPFVAISFSRTHAILRPELLSAPRRSGARVPDRRDLRVRLALPAAVAIIGVVITPMVASQTLLRTYEREAAAMRAERVAQALVGEVDRKDPEALGRFLVEHPDVTVQRGGVAYGPARERIPAESGLVDDDGDGLPEAVAVVRAGEVAVVPIAAPSDHGKRTMGIGVLCLLLTGLATTTLVAAAVHADVLRATRQVRRVARGQIPEPLRADSFHSKELRELVQSVDRLVGRITEANVAKYVVIEKAQEADRLRSQFLANMSHDLRSPLNSVLGFSELLLTGIDGNLEAGQAEQVEVIQRSGRFLLQQIDEILDTAKVDAGRMEVHPEPIPIAGLISRAIDKAKQRVDPRIEFQAEAAAGLPPAFADPYRAVQAVENILVFATERLDEGAIRVRSSAVKGEEGRSLRLEVITPNPPASQAQLERVLGGFFRIPGHHGLGLGLPLAGSILELHRGSLDIREDIESGAMHFIAEFPVPERRRRTRVDSSHPHMKVPRPGGTLAES